jgi:hypothetical protein
MVVRLTNLNFSCPLTAERFMILNYFEGCVEPWVIMRLEVLGKLKLSTSGIESATVRLVALCPMLPCTQTLQN